MGTNTYVPCVVAFLLQDICCCQAVEREQHLNGRLQMSLVQHQNEPINVPKGMGTASLMMLLKATNVTQTAKLSLAIENSFQSK